MSTKQSNDFSKQEAQLRFEAALKGAMNTPHTPLKEKPKAKKKTKAKKNPGKVSRGSQ
jgi:hypothetical protein